MPEGFDEPDDDADNGEHFDVWPENWPAAQLFVACASQWRMVAGMKAVAYAGLDYAGVEAAMRLSGVPRRDRADLFDRIRVMEKAFSRAANARLSG